MVHPCTRVPYSYDSQSVVPIKTVSVLPGNLLEIQILSPPAQKFTKSEAWWTCNVRFDKSEHRQTTNSCNIVTEYSKHHVERNVPESWNSNCIFHLYNDKKEVELN